MNIVLNDEEIKNALIAAVNKKLEGTNLIVSEDSSWLHGVEHTDAEDNLFDHDVIFEVEVIKGNVK